MTHRSRLTAVLVDVPREAHDAEVEFWAGALGREPKRIDNHPEYAFYGEVTPGIEFMVQSTPDPQPRVHVDLETDDVDAEVERLKTLGATEVARIHSWVVMRDPAGVVFCVVKVQVQEMFDAHATTWD
jgi:hypothetical protein